jgi:hypothetical protein
MAAISRFSTLVAAIYLVTAVLGNPDDWCNPATRKVVE